MRDHSREGYDLSQDTRRTDDRREIRRRLVPTYVPLSPPALFLRPFFGGGRRLRRSLALFMPPGTLLVIVGRVSPIGDEPSREYWCVGFEWDASAGVARLPGRRARGNVFVGVTRPLVCRPRRSRTLNMGLSPFP